MARRGGAIVCEAAMAAENMAWHGGMVEGMYQHESSNVEKNISPPEENEMRRHGVVIM